MILSITVIIVILTAITSLMAFSNQKILDDFIFYPPAVSNQNQWYRFITCGLIHADLWHLVFNMIALYSFGQMVEQSFVYLFGEAGKWLYLLMYVTALVVSLLPTYNRHRNDYHYRSLGASGAVSAVIFSGLMLVPNSEVGLIFLPIGIPGFLFGPLFLLITAWLDKRGGGGINHSAHLWGALYGVGFTLVAGYTAGFDVMGQFIGAVRNYFNL